MGAGGTFPGIVQPGRVLTGDLRLMLRLGMSETLPSLPFVLARRMHRHTCVYLISTPTNAHT